MTSLFDPIQAGDLHLANRIAMAPLTRNRSPQAVPRNITATYYAQRASAGLLITEGTAISAQGQGYSDVPGLYGSDQLDGWKKVTQAVHARGGKIVTQLWHVGRVSHSLLQPGRAAPVAPSAVQANAKTYVVDPETGRGEFMHTCTPRALTAEELPDIVHTYAAAARNAVRSAGFDGVEIHGANGYLLEQFLHARSNQRDDAYGGSIANRCRLHLDITDAVAAAVGPERTGIRLSPWGIANDSGEDEPLPLYTHLVQQLARRALVYLHLIEPRASGTGKADIFREGQPSAAAAFRPLWPGVLIDAGGFDRRNAMQTVQAGLADAIAFGRSFIANPDLPRRLREDAVLNPYNRPTFYGGGAVGYTDYPALGAA